MGYYLYSSAFKGISVFKAGRGRMAQLVGRIKTSFWIFVAAVAVLTSGCYDRFSREMGAALKKNPGTQVQLSKMTDFSWDTVYVYGPYHPLDEINGKHGTRLRYFMEFGNSVPEGSCLFLFMEKEKFVKDIDCPRKHCDCHKILDPGVFTSENAVFEVKQNEWGRSYLEWVGSK